jgi:hypothetical protein
MNFFESSSDYVDSIRTIVSKMKDKFSGKPQLEKPVAIPKTNGVMTSHGSWGQFVDFDDEGQAKILPLIKSPRSTASRVSEFTNATKKNALKCWSKKNDVNSNLCIRCLHCEEDLEPEDAMTHWCEQANQSTIHNNEDNHHVKNDSNNDDDTIDSIIKDNNNVYINNKNEQVVKEIDYNDYLSPQYLENHHEEKKEEDMDPWTALARDQYLINYDQSNNQTYPQPSHDTISPSPFPPPPLPPPPPVVSHYSTSSGHNRMIEYTNSKSISIDSNSSTTSSSPSSSPNKARGDSIDAAMFYSSFGPPP